jgi:peptidyl-prolyl cis-trans isomerase D
MFDSVRNNKKIVQLFLAMITLPFAFWGVESYVRNSSSGSEVATVGDSKIGLQELQGALREQEDRFRQQSGGKVDPAMFNTPMMRRAVLDQVINQKLLSVAAQDAKVSVTDADLARFIATVPSLQENGQFSPERYASLVAAQGMSKEFFESRLRQDLAMQQVMLPVGDSSIVGRMSSSRWTTAQLEQREVTELRLLPEAYAAQVKLDTDAAAKFYESNRKQFERPEQVRVEYLVLSQEELLKQANVSDAEIKARYDARADKYKEAETRRASHVLIKASKDAPDAEVKAAQTKAVEIRAAVKKAPADFTRLAAQNSQDPGSASKGGDLDWFGRGMMVKPFEDAVFSMKEGEVSDVVRSDFGFHIIKLTGVRAERVKPLEMVRVEIADELKREQAARKFAEVAEGFGNTVYEQPDSLKPAAEKLKLTIRQSDWMIKGAKFAAPFDNPKLIAAIFSDDAVKNKRNTEAVEVGSGILVSARIVEHKPASLQALDEVKDAISRRLIAEQASRLAAADGAEKLDKLKKGEAITGAWGAPRLVLRASPVGIAPDAVRGVFAADVGKLPAYAAAALPNGAYVLYKVSAVKPATADDPRTVSVSQQYARLVAEEEFSSWMQSLRQRHPVKINQAVLENKERP